MSRASRPVTVMVSCLALLAACQRSGDREPTARFEARWTGSDTAAVKAGGRSVWCPDDQLLELMAIREDHGVGLVVYPDGELAEGRYPAFDPGIDSVPRPGVSAAARWYTDAAIMGFQSDSGSLTLTRAGGRLAGEFNFRLHSLDGEDTIWMSGSFRNMVPGACPTDSLPKADAPE